jgi:hypothetical protein
MNRDILSIMAHREKAVGLVGGVDLAGAHLYNSCNVPLYFASSYS